MGQRIRAMRLNDVAVEAAAISTANKTMVGGAVTGAVGWLSQVNWVGAVGALVAVVGLAANIYFQIRRDRRESAESQARIAALRERCDL